MTLWRKLVCFVVGHKSSLFAGIAPPLAIQWAYPDPTEPAHTQRGPILPKTVVVPSFGITNNVQGFNGPSTLKGPQYPIDLCQRCLALYVSPQPAVCKHCNSTKELHSEGFCTRPCLSCGKPREAHFDEKCPFEASSYQGTKWEKSTSFVSQ